MTVSVAELPAVSAPMFQTPPDQVPVLALELTRLKPDGRDSVTLTPVAFDGPALLAVMVKVTLSPTSGVALSTVLTMARSAD